MYRRQWQDVVSVMWKLRILLPRIWLFVQSQN